MNCYNIKFNRHNPIVKLLKFPSKNLETMVDNLSEQEKPDFLEFQALKRAGMLSETIKLAKEQLRLMDGKSVVNNVHHLSIENYNYTLDNEDFDKNDEVACETIQVKRSIGTFGEDYVLNI